MNEELNCNEKLVRLREANIGTIDVTSRVMARIRAEAQQTRGSRKRPSFLSWGAGAALLALALILWADIPAYASSFWHWSWNGIRFSVDKTSAHPSNAASNGETAFKDRISAALRQSGDVWSTVSLQDAEKALSFAALRPDHYREMKLADTFGVLKRDANYRVKSENELWLEGIYDIFENGRKSVVVIQKPEKMMNLAQRNGGPSIEIGFDGAWEVVQSTDRALMMYREDGEENVLLVDCKTADRRIVSLELTGSGGVTKAELLHLAVAYVGEG
jgi:hypothetical protein